MQLSPLLDEAHRRLRELTADRRPVVDADKCFVFGIDRMEVRRIVIGEVHVDRNPVNSLGRGTRTTYGAKPDVTLGAPQLAPSGPRWSGRYRVGSRRGPRHVERAAILSVSSRRAARIRNIEPGPGCVRMKWWWKYNQLVNVDSGENVAISEYHFYDKNGEEILMS